MQALMCYLSTYAIHPLGAIHSHSLAPPESNRIELDRDHCKESQPTGEGRYNENEKEKEKGRLKRDWRREKEHKRCGVC